MTRGLVILFIGAVDAWVSYAPEEHKKSVEERVAEMRDKAQISRAGAEMAAVRASAWLKAGKSAARSAFSNEDEEDSEENDEGNSDPESDPEPLTESENITPIKGKGKKRKKVVSEDVTKNRIFKLLEQNPKMPSNLIMKRTHSSLSSVSKYKGIFREQHPELYTRSRKRA